MSGGFHLRCSRCRLHLAGPLSPAESKRGSVAFEDVAVGFDECVAVRDILFPTGDLFGFRHESGDDLLVHPQWCEGWRRDWPDRAPGGATRRMSTVTRGYGCCGPQGAAECGCGAAVGWVMADCIGPQWMVFFHAKVDRSDRHDGPWTIRSDAGGPDRWHEESGELIRNRRDGEWERWLVVPELVPVRRRGDDREFAIVREERLERRLVGSAGWSEGRLICEIGE